MKSKNVFFFILLCLLTSCSFNHQFYDTEKIPATVKQERIITKTGDTTYLNIGRGYQPSFTDNKNNPLPLSYTFESINFKNSKGDNLVGWFAKPKDKTPAITMLLLHGNGTNILIDLFSIIQLVKQGFQVFTFDYSGYGFSEGKPTRKRVLADVNDALNALLARPDVKDTKVIIYGESMGGQLAATSASENEAKINALVMEGAPSSHKAIAARKLRPFGFVARILVKNEYSSIKSVEHYHKPLLVIQSSEDQIVPLSMGRKIYDHANQPKSFYEIKYGHIAGLSLYADSIAVRIKNLVSR
jgi:dipeptidyl aminopeptidase/acylaminoacyl peptidase